jgi:hypothetical protein
MDRVEKYYFVSAIIAQFVFPVQICLPGFLALFCIIPLFWFTWGDFISDCKANNSEKRIS